MYQGREGFELFHLKKTLCLSISGETLCRDNFQLIGLPFFHTRSAGKNNRN